MKAKEYTDNQVEWLRRNNEAEITAIREAVDKVEITSRQAVDKVEANNIAKFAAQNEWRAQMKDQTGTFVTRRELWAAVVAIVAIVLGLMSYIK